MTEQATSDTWSWKTEGEIWKRRVTVLIASDVGLLLTLIHTEINKLTCFDWAVGVLLAIAIPMLIEVYFNVERFREDDQQLSKKATLAGLIFGAGMILSVCAYVVALAKLSWILAAIFAGTFVVCASFTKLLRIR